MARRSRSPVAPTAAAASAMPDRPLEAAGELPVVAVRAAGNHPFVYRKMVIGPVGNVRPSDGDLVRVVDRFDDVLSVEVFSLGMYQRIGSILPLLAARLGTRHGRVTVDERIALAEDFPGRPLASPQLPPRVTIQEHGVRFRVAFEGSHKTGFF